MAVHIALRLKNRDTIIQAIRRKTAEMAPDGPAVRMAMTRAAMLIVNQAKLNIRRHGLIDEGRLINSLRFEFFRPDPQTTGIRIGSFGVPYAAFWEFGYHGTMAVRAHNRLITEAFGKPIAPRVVSVAAHSRTRNQPAKPYLFPAYEMHRERVAQLIAEAIGEAG